MSHIYHLPTKPYNIIDCINRIAAATGSPSYARATSSAGYNGHHLTLSWNDYRGYYVLEYYYGERVVLHRGKNAEDAIKIAKEEYKRQGKGGSLSIALRDEDKAIGDADPDLRKGRETEEDMTWFSWRHKEASFAMKSNETHKLLRAHNYDHWRRLQGWIPVANGQSYSGFTIDRDAAQAEWEKIKDLPPILD